MQTPHRKAPALDSNLWPFRCEAVVLTTACHSEAAMTHCTGADKCRLGLSACCHCPYRACGYCILRMHRVNFWGHAQLMLQIDARYARWPSCAQERIVKSKYIFALTHTSHISTRTCTQACFCIGNRVLSYVLSCLTNKNKGIKKCNIRCFFKWPWLRDSERRNPKTHLLPGTEQVIVNWVQNVEKAAVKQWRQNLKTKLENIMLIASDFKCDESRATKRSI